MIAASQTRSLFDSSSSRDWVITFAKNTQRWRQFARGLDFDTLRLEPELIESIKIFQLGEQGEGRTLTALAKQHAQQHDDPNYLSAIQQFIGEEQRHAGYIAKALQANGMAPIEKQWSDGLFRKVRKLCGWEVMISVLLTAEVIAIAYYAALAQASKAPQAKQLFERILQDETVHLQFHGESLSRIRHPRWSVKWGLHRLFLQAVTGIVWYEHRQVLRHRFSTYRSLAYYCERLLVNLI